MTINTQTGLYKLWKTLRANSWAATAIDSVALLVILVLVVQWQGQHLLAADGTRQAPDLELQSLSGDLVSLQSQNAETTVVYFFSPWCAVCNASFNNLEDLKQARPGNELSIIAVALDWSQRQDVQRFVDEHRVSFPVILGNPKVAADWKIRAYPTYYVLDQDGKIVGRSLGYSSELGLRFRT
jgi:peroxiredoxin